MLYPVVAIIVIMVIITSLVLWVGSGYWSTYQQALADANAEITWGEK